MAISKMSEEIKGFISGAFAGVTQVFVMQPFQKIKLRQVNEHDGSFKYHGFLRSYKTIMKEEGFLSFYQGTIIQYFRQIQGNLGTKSPLIGYGLQCSLQFGFNRFFRRLLSEFNGNETYFTLLLASILTGIPSAISVTPADHIRILMQKEDHGRKEAYKGELQAVQDVLKRHGIRGLYLGFNCTLIRQLLAMGLFFTSFVSITRLMSHDREGGWLQKTKIMLAGGTAGLISWVVTYPIDFVKTKLQSQDLDHKKYRGMLNCFQRVYKKYGLIVFTRGLTTVCLRSIPVNAVAFLAEDEMGVLLNRKPIS